MLVVKKSEMTITVVDNKGDVIYKEESNNTREQCMSSMGTDKASGRSARCLSQQFDIKQNCSKKM
jgi:hypothetical protein